MSEIYAERIATNRYAPEGANAISLFGYNGVEGLTLGQLVNAVSIRRAAHHEQQSVVIMNELMVHNTRLSNLSAITDRILSATGEWSAGDRDYLIKELGCDPKNLPERLDSYAKRMEAFEIARTKMTELNGTVDRIAIKLQSTISRRDSVYSLATMTVQHLGKSEMSVAGAFR